MLLLPCPGPKAPLEEETAKSIFFLSLFFPKSFCKLFLLNRGHLVVLAVSAPRGPVRPTVPAPTRAYPCLPGGAACAAAPSRGARPPSSTSTSRKIFAGGWFVRVCHFCAGRAPVASLCLSPRRVAPHCLTDPSLPTPHRPVAPLTPRQLLPADSCLCQSC